MLNIETIVFPVRFYTNPDNRGEFIDYKDAESKGVWFDGAESKIPLDHFIRQHNAVNKGNVHERPYQYSTLMKSVSLNGCTPINGAMLYAEVAARNMFGRDESRGIVNRAVIQDYGEGLKIKKPGEVLSVVGENVITENGAFKIDKDGKAVFNDAVMRNEVNATKTEPFEPCRKGWKTIRNAVIGDSLILGGVIHSAIDNRDEKIKELEEKVSFLTGRLEAVSKAMRSEGEDVVTHAKVLRQMADALVNIWCGE